MVPAAVVMVMTITVMKVVQIGEGVLVTVMEAEVLVAEVQVEEVLVAEAYTDTLMYSPLWLESAGVLIASVPHV